MQGLPHENAKKGTTFSALLYKTVTPYSTPLRGEKNILHMGKDKTIAKKQTGIRKMP